MNETDHRPIADSKIPDSRAPAGEAQKFSALSQSLKQDPPRETRSPLQEHLAGYQVVASVSGGKDSAAAALYLRELGIEHRRVFLDTGWEHPATYEYLRGELTRVLGRIEEIRGPLSMVELVLLKGMFPSRRRRFCTEQLKILPMRRYLSALGGEALNVVGIRAEESKARSLLPEWEWSEAVDCDVWRPLIAWSLDDVIAIHKRHGLKPNPLYLLGANRVGCWPCIFARKAEIRLMADIDPGRIAELRELEHRVTAQAAARYQEKGETLQYHRGWFQAPLGESGEPWPIDQVVTWSRTARGGRQLELFAPSDGDAGCMRWGLCETDAAETPHLVVSIKR